MANLDGRTDEGELASLAELGIESIALDYVAGDGSLQSSFKRVDGSSGAAVDVWLPFF